MPEHCEQSWLIKLLVIIVNNFKSGAGPDGLDAMTVTLLELG